MNLFGLFLSVALFQSVGTCEVTISGVQDNSRINSPLNGHYTLVLDSIQSGMTVYRRTVVKQLGPWQVYVTVYVSATGTAINWRPESVLFWSSAGYYWTLAWNPSPVCAVWQGAILHPRSALPANVNATFGGNGTCQISGAYVPLYTPVPGEGMW